MSRPQSFGILVLLFFGLTGCAQIAPLPEYTNLTQSLRMADPAGTLPTGAALATTSGPALAPPPLSGPQPVDVYIRHALAENQLVQAARYNVLALRYRVPQVMALDDPVVSSTYYPSADYGPQTPDGFMPWNLLVAQQFPWFGTLALRGLAAEQDAQVALAELCAAQLDTVEAVKRAYSDLSYGETAERILLENRALVDDFLEIARTRYETGEASQQDVLSAEVARDDLERDLLGVRQGIAAARAELAEQLHVSPESDLRALPGAPVGDVPAQLDRLYELAAAARPELRGRRAAIARDATAVELARLRYRPNVTLGLSYSLMTTTGAMVPDAEGNDGFGMFLGFNVPIYHQKNDAAVREAQARALADAKLLEAERDGTFRTIKDLFSQAQAQAGTLSIVRERILPRAREALELATSDYQAGLGDFLVLMTAWREVLQIELQAAQIESILGKTLASLERAVGLEINTHPPAPTPAAPVPPPVPETATGPFTPRPPAGDEPAPADAPEAG